MNPREAEDAFVERVKDAAEQLWLMRTWEFDRQLEEEGWTTYYAVDADIFGTYGSAVNVAQRTTGRLGYSQVFHDDPLSGSLALAERLIDYIFFRLNPASPLLVVPPIDNEIRTILYAQTMRLGREPSPASVDDLAIATAISDIQNVDKAAAIPKDVLTSFSRLLALRGQSLANEYRRLTNLLLTRRIVPSHSIGPEDNYPAALVSALNAPDNLREIYDHAELSEEWIKRYDRISAKQRGSKKQNFIRDAYALARVELWNRKLAPSKIRLLYITGAQSILDATLQYKVTEKSFFFEYIRHPRYFLASPQVVVRTENEQTTEVRPISQFYEWIVTFLADCRLEDTVKYNTAGDFRLDTRFENAAKTAFARDKSLGADLRLRWNEYLEYVSASYVPPDQIIHQIGSDLGTSRQQNALADWVAFRQQIDQRIEEENDRAWEACFKTATKAGYFVGHTVQKASREPPSRLVPPLRFDRWPKTEEFVRFMSEWRDPQKDIVEQYESRLQQVKDETGEDFLYAYYLAHAALFAARGEWRIGAILSVRAKSKASHPNPDKGTTGHGREAAYLAAYCLRHNFRGPSDLDEAESYLDQAEAIHLSEIALKPDLEALPERFLSERLALSTTREFAGYYLARSASHDYRKVWLELRERFVDLTNNLIARQGTADISQSRLINNINRLRSRVDANIMMMSILAEDLAFQPFLEAGQRLHMHLEAAVDNHSFFLDTLDLFWRVATHTDYPKRSEVKDRFEENRIAKHSILPYDTLRYHELRERLQRFMKASPPR